MHVNKREMKIAVLLFGPARILAKKDHLVLELKEGATVFHAMSLLKQKFPEFSNLDRYLRFAIDAEYVERNASLSEGQTLALIPPVQGG